MYLMVTNLDLLKQISRDARKQISLQPQISREPNFNLLLFYLGGGESFEGSFRDAVGRRKVRGMKESSPLACGKGPCRIATVSQKPKSELPSSQTEGKRPANPRGSAAPGGGGPSAEFPRGGQILPGRSGKNRVQRDQAKDCGLARKKGSLSQMSGAASGPGAR